MRLGNRGMSMIEMMIASVIFSLCTYAAFKLVGVATRTTQAVTAGMATQPAELRDSVAKFGDDFRTRTTSGGGAAVEAFNAGNWSGAAPAGLPPCSDVRIRRNLRTLDAAGKVITLVETVRYETLCTPTAGTTEQPLHDELTCASGNARVRITRVAGGTTDVEVQPSETSPSRGMAMCFRVDNARQDVSIETASLYPNPAPEKGGAQNLRTEHKHKYRMGNQAGIELVPPVTKRVIASGTGNGNGTGNSTGNTSGNSTGNGNGEGNSSSSTGSGNNSGSSNSGSGNSSSSSGSGNGGGNGGGFWKWFCKFVSFC